MQFLLLQQLNAKLKDLKRTITIRQKLLAGAGLIIAFSLIISLYAIMQLRQLDTLITTAVTVDAKMLRSSESLKSLLLVQLGNERKFSITNDSDFLLLFDENTRDFRAALSSMQEIAQAGEVRGLLAGVSAAYERYAGLAKAGFSRPEPARQKAEEAVIDSLEALNATAQQELNRRMEDSQQISSVGARFAMLLALATAVCGMLFALLIMRSIYLPLRRLKDATHYIARGDFSKKIDIARQDEIGELSESFNIMCERLLALERLKSDFISNITHDLKTPLASITEANQLMLDGAAGVVSPQQQRLLGIIREDSGRLMRLISAIIELAKMESGILSYDLAPVDISMLMLEAVESVRFLAASKQIALTYEPDRSLPELLIDDDKMRQALINLLSNAIKFTPAGGSVTVAAARTDSRPAEYAAGQAVLISIADTGMGIREEDLPRIFEKFFRGAADSGGAGSGLGLTIAHHIVQAHGGRIWAESSSGQGSIFYVLLPVRGGDDAASVDKNL